MFHRFFKQSLNTLKNNKRLIENTAFTACVGASLYYHPKASKEYTQACMTSFYDRLSEDEKLAIEHDPEKKQEFLAECRDNLRLIIGPPD